MAASKMKDALDFQMHFGEDLLSCSICFEGYNNPKVLPCLHTFCQDCVHRHYEIYKVKTLSLIHNNNDDVHIDV